MKQFHGKVAVVTGAASGIGYAIAEECARRGMRMVLADVERSALAEAEPSIRELGTEVVSVLTDVSRQQDVERLRERAFEAFGGVHLLFNNAGVGAGSTVWDSTLKDWEWVIGVNLWGVIYGCNVFVPAMLSQSSPCHIVNTASMAALIPYMSSAPYQVTKNAVVTLSENLYHSLAMLESQIKVSVLCPGWVRTRIMSSQRNRPSQGGAPRADASGGVDEETVWQNIEAENRVVSPAEVAKSVFDAIEREQFWIRTHPDEFEPPIRARCDSILTGTNPALL